MFSIIQLTPPARGAIATLRVEGPGAVESLAAEFRVSRGRAWTDRAVGELVHGHIGPAPGEEVVLCRDGGQAAWIHCHGGSAVVAMIRQRFEARGGVWTDWRAWADRAEADSIASAARRALADARTERTAAILLDQYRGALGRAMAEIRAALAGGRHAEAAAGAATLLARAPLGLHLTRPWQIVLAGRPNVGKSSLMNALLGYDRAIIHPAPGTTRDLVSAATAIDGWPVELCDTAGVRAAGEPIERLGVALAREKIAAADLVLLVVDRSEDAEGPDADWSNPEKTLLVENKCDLPAGAGHGQGLPISAQRGDGIGELLATISRRLVPNPPPPGAAVPFCEEQVRELEGSHHAPS